MLPRKPLNILKTKLAQIEQSIRELNVYRTSDLGVSGLSRPELEARIKRTRRMLELAIREAFLKFMAQILANYKSFQLTVSKRPDMKAKDRNLTKFFDSESFIRSKDTQCQTFYRELTRTQLFYDCIMNLSFTTELDSSLADSFFFFAEICNRLSVPNHLINSPTSPTGVKNEDEKLLELYECENGQTVVVLPPTVASQPDTPGKIVFMCVFF